jgi:hypothetical protein
MHKEKPPMGGRLFGRRPGTESIRAKRGETLVNTEVPINIMGPSPGRLMSPNFICIAPIVCLDSPSVQGGSPTWPAGCRGESASRDASQRTSLAGLVPKHEDARRHPGLAMSHQQSEHRRLSPDGFPQGMMRSSVQSAGTVSASAIDAVKARFAPAGMEIAAMYHTTFQGRLWGRLIIQ